MRRFYHRLLLFTGTATTIVEAAKFDRAACQAPNKEDEFVGCPPNTLVVGPDRDFSKIQSAVISMPDNDIPYAILIEPGEYVEQVNITRRGPVTLLGVTKNPNDYTANTVRVLWRDATTMGGKDNAFTSTLTIAPKRDASLTGQGPTGYPASSTKPFEKQDFRAYNIDFVNDFKPFSAGPSLAVGVSSANASFYYCAIRSYQDTVYVGKLGNAYFFDGEIAGQTDFLYGFGTAWIQSAKLALRGCGGGITAWKGTDTTSPNKYGVYINNSRVEKANKTLSIAERCFLGRPWNSRHRSIFANSFLDDSIRPGGYENWSDRYDKNLTLMGEYRNKGPGARTADRNNFTKVLSQAEFEPYSTLERVFQFPDGRFGNTAWIDGKPEARKPSA